MAFNTSVLRWSSRSMLVTAVNSLGNGFWTLVSWIMAQEEKVSTMPGLWKYPTHRDFPIKHTDMWLEGKREDDGAEGLWRIHDDLYDLSQWVHNHPGGADWLTMTKGTDITEAFECHHIAQTAERLLPHFHVRRATSRRNSPYTFAEDGFYRTLKRRVREAMKDKPSGSTLQSRLIADGLCCAALLTAILAAASRSYLLASVSGFLLSLTVISAHNFFHQKDNFRMYYFDLSPMSSRDWRVSHALSHHLYPNTLLDFEVSVFEPLLQWLPREKSTLARYGSWLYSPIVYSAMFFIPVIFRLILAARGNWHVFRAEQLVTLVLPAAMFLYGGLGPLAVLPMWGWILVVSSFCFGAIGLNAGHHREDTFHDGDAPRSDRDWGLNQLDAVRDRKEVSGNLFLVLTTFGDHALHHLFPTIDHGRLNDLYPILEKTCAEFGLDYKTAQTATVLECIVGQFRQLARTQTNPIPRDQRELATLAQ